MQKFLLIQTAFIGDVVLATALTEKLNACFPDAQIDFLLRKGNEGLLQKHPFIHKVHIWDKKKNKTRNLFSLLSTIRANRYDKVINLQRYFSTGMLTAFSGATEKIGFDKNPLSFLFTTRIKHSFDVANPRHEVEKNNDLIEGFTNRERSKPVLYPTKEDYNSVKKYTVDPFISISPTSVWFTKAFPAEKWINLMDQLPHSFAIYLLGGKDNFDACTFMAQRSTHPKITVLAGQLSFLGSAALMKSAHMNYTNDSAPLHFASAMNAPVTAIFCSTSPAFGYTPLSTISYIVETKVPLNCKPCGIHGKKACPEGHFKCGFTIDPQQLLETLNLH